MQGGTLLGFAAALGDETHIGYKVTTTHCDREAWPSPPHPPPLCTLLHPEDRLSIPTHIPLTTSKSSKIAKS
jgi:hypothetical protein